MSIIDLSQGTGRDGTARYATGDKLLWKGQRLEVVDVAPLTPSHHQVTLRPLDREGLPISVLASDLLDAVPA